MRKAIALLVLLAACTYPSSGPTSTEPSETTAPPASTEPGGEFIPGEVFIEETAVSIAESFPMQLFLQVNGQLPTPCHELVWEVEESPGRFDVTIESRIDPTVTCIAVLEPFEENIKLGDTEGGLFEIYINGELVETLDV